MAQLNTLGISLSVLSNNKIAKIEGVNMLKCLKKLSLSHNSIGTIENLEQNIYLQDLKLNANKITGIGKGLNANINIQALDIGNNSISDPLYGHYQMPAQHQPHQASQVA